jgi:hypothetical protein
MEVTGRCHCGAISYRGTVDPQTVGICHCTDCQTLSGSAYRVSVPAPAQSFKLLSGQPKVYIKTAESGNKRAHAFCPDCGAPVYATAISNPQTYSLRVGALDQRASLPPRRQIWCKSALPWSAHLDDDIPKIARQ